MRQRFMRVMVFFDLPVLTSADRRRYSKFRKYLLNQGFVMMQKSVYSKIALNGSASTAIVKNLKKNRPGTGHVQVLVITEKQFQGIEYITGERQDDVIDSIDLLVFI